MPIHKHELKHRTFTIRSAQSRKKIADFKMETDLPNVGCSIYRGDRKTRFTMSPDLNAINKQGVIVIDRVIFEIFFNVVFLFFFMFYVFFFFNLSWLVSFGGFGSKSERFEKQRTDNCGRKIGYLKSVASGARHARGCLVGSPSSLVCLAIVSLIQLVIPYWQGTVAVLSYKLYRPSDFR